MKSIARAVRSLCDMALEGLYLLVKGMFKFWFYMKTHG
jgi:hypothetical protein